MSRSRRKPVWTDGYGSKSKRTSKRAAARAVRAVAALEAPQNGKAYRKEFNPWDIADYKIYDPKNPKAGRKLRRRKSGIRKPEPITSVVLTGSTRSGART